MHRARGFFLASALLAMFLAIASSTAQAALVPSLFVVVVPGSDPQQAAQVAMRVELVRLTGTRAAASDPALAGLIDAARQYVTERAMTTGQIQVLFNEAALTGALAAAGRSIWSADRPLLWILLPQLDAATAEALRARLDAAADERGLPITVVSAGTPPAGTPPGAASAANPAATAPVRSLSAADALDAARRAGASAALVAQAPPSDPTLLQWTLTAPTTSGQWTGGPELAIDEATDTLASAARALGQAPVAQYQVHISGVGDLAGFVDVLTAVRAAPGITQVAVSDIDGDELTLELGARGSAVELEHALTSDQLRATGAGTGGSLQYRYTAGR